MLVKTVATCTKLWLLLSLFIQLLSSTCCSGTTLLKRNTEITEEE